MCENADVESFRATVESARWRGPIIVAVKANFSIQYFVPVSRKSFSHSLDPLRTLRLMRWKLLLPISMPIVVPLFVALRDMVHAPFACRTPISQGAYRSRVGPCHYRRIGIASINARKLSLVAAAATAGRGSKRTANVSG